MDPQTPIVAEAADSQAGTLVAAVAEQLADDDRELDTISIEFLSGGLYRFVAGFRGVPEQIEGHITVNG